MPLAIGQRVFDGREIHLEEDCPNNIERGNLFLPLLKIMSHKNEEIQFIHLSSSCFRETVALHSHDNLRYLIRKGKHVVLLEKPYYLQSFFLYIQVYSEFGRHSGNLLSPKT